MRQPSRFCKLAMVLGLLLLLCPASALAAGRIVGKVIGEITDTPLAGARIRLVELGRVARAGPTGAFAFEGVPAGSYTLEAGAAGYSTAQRKVNLSDGGDARIDFVLLLATETLVEEVVVTEKREVIDETPQTSATTFTREAVEKQAGMFEDVAKAVQALPGVVRNSQFTADMYVRGADNWENIIVLDRVFLINPYHFGAGLSVINTDLVDQFTFYSGGFPAQYPLATGSILDVTYIDGNSEQVEGSVTASMLSAYGHVGGPLFTDKVTWLVSARRSYYDWLINALGASNIPVPYFSDYYAKMTFQPGADHVIRAWALRSEDGAEAKLDDMDEENASSVDEGDALYQNIQQIFGLDWGWAVSPKVLLDSGLAYQIQNTDASISGTDPIWVQAQINVSTFREDLTLELHPQETLKLGVDGAWLEFQVDSLLKIEEWVSGANTGDEADFFRIPFEQSKPYFLVGPYLTNEWTIVPDRLRLDVGMRADYFDNDANPAWHYSPRASTALNIAEGSVLKASWGLYHSMPMNVLAVDEVYGNPDLLSEKSVHYVLGYEQALTENSMARVELYYKDLYDLVFQDIDWTTIDLGGVEVQFADPTKDLHYYNSGRGRAYGIELFVQKKLSGRWDGWLAYTLGWVDRISGLDDDIGWYHPLQDQRHTINAVGNYTPWPDRGWTFSLDFSAASGKPYTPIDDWQMVGEGTPFRAWVPVSGEINSARFPWKSQLNVRVQKDWKIRKRVTIGTFIEIYNVYNAHNVYDYFYTEQSELEKPTRMTLFDLPFLPFLGVKCSF
ncbi:MAG: TonB-dependent receptor [Candidatus Alcyoniella australis]|nr:TonB-dependent receptor [Candidatus Alcyoniella australis]